MFGLQDMLMCRLMHLSVQLVSEACDRILNRLGVMLLQMQGCAKRSVSLLDRAAAGQHTFDTLFLTNQSPLTVCDHLFHVHVEQLEGAGLHSDDVPPWRQAEKQLEALVKQVS